MFSQVSQLWQRLRLLLLQVMRRRKVSVCVYLLVRCWTWLLWLSQSVTMSPVTLIVLLRDHTWATTHQPELWPVPVSLSVKADIHNHTVSSVQDNLPDPLPRPEPRRSSSPNSNPEQWHLSSVQPKWVQYWSNWCWSEVVASCEKDWCLDTCTLSCDQW